MKKIFFSIFFTIQFLSNCFSQDIITKLNGTMIQAKVIEVSALEVKYKRIDNIEGPLFVLPKSELLMILYQNGTKDIFTQERSVQNNYTNTPTVNQFSNNSPTNKNDFEYENNGTNNDMFLRGKTDASRYYRGYKGAGTVTLLTSLLLLPAGLIPAVICSSTTPRENNFSYSNSQLMGNPDYFNGYTSTAHKIKKNKVWTNFGIAFGISVLALVSLQTN